MKFTFKRLAWCLGLLFAASTCFAQMYTVTDLGTLRGSWSEATGINASGQVVGTSDFPDNALGNLWHAFRTAPNSPINSTTDDLNTAPCNNFTRDLCFSAAYGINDRGQVVGMLHYLGADVAPFRTAGNRRIDFPGDVMTWADEGSAYGINNSGQAVGADSGYGGRALRMDASSTSAWHDLGRGRGAVAYGINDPGQVVGSYNSHAFRTAPDSNINLATDDLGTLGGSSSSASAINAFGQVVGWASISGDAAFHAFRTAPNGTINAATDGLGTLGGSFSSATDVNNFGQVVGWASLAADAVQHAFLYDSGMMHDLNDLIPAGSNCALAGVEYLHQYGDSPDINDAGQIAANVICNGQPHAVRLDPIYKAFVQQPINADGSSVFTSNRGVVPVKFTLTQYNTPTCTLPSATIAITRAAGRTLASVDESIYGTAANDGSNFRTAGCKYHYNLATGSLGVGTYRVDVNIAGIMVGHAVFALK